VLRLEDLSLRSQIPAAEGPGAEDWLATRRLSRAALNPTARRRCRRGYSLPGLANSGVFHRRANGGADKSIDTAAVSVPQCARQCLPVALRISLSGLKARLNASCARPAVSISHRCSSGAERDGGPIILTSMIGRQLRRIPAPCSPQAPNDAVGDPSLRTISGQPCSRWAATSGPNLHTSNT